MKKLLFLTLVAAFVLTGAQQAAAFSMDGYEGPVKFVFTGFSKSADQEYSPDDFGFNYPTGPGVPTGDPAIFFGDHDLDGDGNDESFGETWGILSLDSIKAVDQTGTVLGPDVWTSPGDPSESSEGIFGFFRGLYDHEINGTDTNGDGTDDSFNVRQVGGVMDLFLSPDGAVEIGSTQYLQDPANRTDQNVFETITDIPGAQHFLSLEFNSGVIPGDSDVTVSQVLNSFTSPASGDGLGFADVVDDDDLADDGYEGSGDYAWAFDSERIVDANGDNHDFLVEFTIQEPNSGSAWAQELNSGSADGYAIPEPATMVLMGSGLLGMIGARRRKRA